MPAKDFFDTNILIYAVAENDARASRAEQLLAGGGVIGVQTLNEFVAIGRRKFEMSWKEIATSLEAFCTLCPDPVPVTLDVHKLAVAIAAKYKIGIYDALTVSAAIQAGCDTLYSEDLQDGQLIDGRLSIRNPFR